MTKTQNWRMNVKQRSDEDPHYQSDLKMTGGMNLQGYSDGYQTTEKRVAASEECQTKCLRQKTQHRGSDPRFELGVSDLALTVYGLDVESRR